MKSVRLLRKNKPVPSAICKAASGHTRARFFVGRDRQARGKKRTELVRSLRAAGMPGTDGSIGALLATMERLGGFRLGGTLVGTRAFRLHEGELGIRMPGDNLAQTGDIDITLFERLSLALSSSLPIADVQARTRSGPARTAPRPPS